MDDPRIVRVPVQAVMRWNKEQGRFVLVPEESTYADLPAAQVARYIAEHFPAVAHLVGKRPGAKEEGTE